MQEQVECDALPAAHQSRISFVFIVKMTAELKKTDTERDRGTAKRITDCILSVLKFWRICRKKKKPAGPGYAGQTSLKTKPVN